MTAITRVAAGALVFVACTGPEDPTIDSTEQAVSVTWTNAVGVTTSGNDLTKSSATAGWNAGASSVESLSGDGFVEFTTAEASTAKAAGLGNGDATRSYTDIEFAIQLRANGTIAVYESGTLRGSFGAFAAGDLFRVEVTAGVVRYKKNGVTLYTSALAPSFPLVVDTSLNTPGATINDVVLVSTGLDWQNAVGVAVSGRNLTKTITGTWNAGASSVQTITGDGFLEFTTAENTTGKMVGLSSDDSSVHYSDIDFAFYLKANGVFTVYEGGLARASNLGTYLAGDLFRIEADAGTVRYLVNGSVVFTSEFSATFPSRIDTSFLTNGGTVQNATLEEAAFACPAYDGGGPVCSGSYTVANSSDLAVIASCAEITGNLTIQAPGMTRIALPALERVGGNLTIGNNPDLVRLLFPALKEVGGTLSASPAPITTGFDLSRLRTAGAVTLGGETANLRLGCLETVGNLTASDVSIPRLTTVTGSVSGTINFAPALETVGGSIAGQMYAPVLSTVGGSISGQLSAPQLVTVSGNVVARVLDAASLTFIGGGLDYWSDTNVPALERAGSLTLKEPSVIELPNLVEVTGLLRGGTYPCVALGDPIATATELDLPALERVGALHLCTHFGSWDDTWPLTSLSLPALQEVTGPAASTAWFTAGLWIGDTGSIPQVTLPSLLTVVGPMEIYFPVDAAVLNDVQKKLSVRADMSAPALLQVHGPLELHALLSADALELVGGKLQLNDATVVSFPALTSVRGIRADRAFNLVTLDLPSLQTVLQIPPGSPTGTVEIANTNLITLSMPALTSVAADLIIRRNFSLTDIDYSSLTSVGPLLRIQDNFVLPTCQATNLRDQLVANGWTGTATISGNDDGGTCP